MKILSFMVSAARKELKTLKRYYTPHQLPEAARLS
jgi:hypothetical protein